MARSIVEKTDSYKFSHWKQIPEKTQYCFSYYESRKDQDEIVFGGLQPILYKHLVGEVFNMQDIAIVDDMVTQHIGPGIFNRAGWESMYKKHGGRLPVRICAVPEGMTVPSHNVLMTIENTDPEFPWLPNYLETVLSHVWYPCTIASNGKKLYSLLKMYMEKSCDTLDALPFKLHDFGYRGVSCDEQAGIGGAMHLIHFRGSDTFAAVDHIFEFYSDDVMPTFSIPASEHFTMTIWGRNGEENAFDNMLEKFPNGNVACVSDTYDIFKACGDLWGIKLKDKILAREGTLVIRPDSGDPLYVIPKVLQILWDRFGGTVNTKGFKVLDSHVRIIQGDGIDFLSIGALCEKVIACGFSLDNIFFGSGGGLLQKWNRDTYKFVFKASWAVVDGIERNLYKEPITDPGKNSKKGRLSLIRGAHGLVTVPGDAEDNLLQCVFENGSLKLHQTWDSVCSGQVS